jgi:protein-S-isoprenylcysteine O-methyltransferase Ste14
MIGQWFIQFDRLLIFNPARWPHRELLSRITALVVVAGVLCLRIYRFDRFPQTWSGAWEFYSHVQTAGGQPLFGPAQIAAIWCAKLLVWLIETGILVGYIAAYTSRSRALSIAQGFMQTGFPIIVAGLPVLITLAPHNPAMPFPTSVSAAGHIGWYLMIMGLIATGGLINLIGLWTMRRAFTIMSEARALIAHGIFRCIRHPLYSGHFIMFLGTLLLRLHTVTVILYILFCCGQVWRARIEECKLEQVFEPYRQYRQKTGMFWPRWKSQGCTHRRNI